MRNLSYLAFGTALCATLACTSLGADTAPPGFIDFGKFSPPANGGEFVEVHVSSNLISMAARLAEPSEPDIASLIRGLKGIHVNVIGLSEENRAELQGRMKKIRESLDTQGWERVVVAQKKDEDVGVYIKTRGEEAVQGVAVTVMENKQAVLVNIVGDLKPEKVAVIGERFNIEPLKKLGVPQKKS